MNNLRLYLILTLAVSLFSCGETQLSEGGPEKNTKKTQPGPKSDEVNTKPKPEEAKPKEAKPKEPPKAEMRPFDKAVLEAKVKEEDEKLIGAEKAEEAKIAQRESERQQRDLREQNEFDKTDDFLTRLKLIFNPINNYILNSLFQEKDASYSMNGYTYEKFLGDNPWRYIAKALGTATGKSVLVSFDILRIRIDELAGKIEMRVLGDKGAGWTTFNVFVSKYPIEKLLAEVIKLRKYNEEEQDRVDIAKLREQLKKNLEDNKRAANITEVIYEIFNDKGLSIFRENKSDLPKYFSGVYAVGEDKILELISALRNYLGNAETMLFKPDHDYALLNDWYFRIYDTGKIRIGEKIGGRVFTESNMNTVSLKQAIYKL